MKTHPLSVIILAAGKGTRMKSSRAKVLHEVFFAPMIQHVINVVTPLQPEKSIIVVGHQHEAVTAAIKNSQVTFAVQNNQLGTGHAVLAAQNSLAASKGVVMILCGDTPLIPHQTLKKMYTHHLQTKATLTLLTTILDNPTNYGRIVCDTSGQITEIVEQKDCLPEQDAIKEINAGIYCVEKGFLFSALNTVGTDNSQGEIYLTDIVKIAVSNGHRVEKYTASSPVDILGVNSRIELATAQKELCMRRNIALMELGVTMHDPETITVCPHSSVGMDSVLHKGVTLSDNTTIGQSCVICQGAILSNCTVGNNSIIGPYSCLTGVNVPPDTTLKGLNNH